MTNDLIINSYSRANMLDQVQALDMTSYLKKEKKYVPWITAISSLGYIGSMLEGNTDDPESYKLYEVCICVFLTEDKVIEKYTAFKFFDPMIQDISHKPVKVTIPLHSFFVCLFVCLFVSVFSIQYHCLLLLLIISCRNI